MTVINHPHSCLRNVLGEILIFTSLLLTTSQAQNERPQLIVQLGHAGRVTAIAFSTSGQLILTGGTGGEVILWERASGRILRRLTGHEKEVLAVKFRADEQQVITVGNDGTARVWETATGKEMQRLDLGEKTIGTVSILQDGDRIAFSTLLGRAVRMWSFKAAAQIGEYRGRSNIIRDFALSADGRYLALTHRATIQIIEVASGQEVGALMGHTGNVVMVEFSPNGDRIVTRGADRTLRLWDAGSKQEIQKAVNVSSMVDSFAFSHDGQRVVLFSRRGSGSFLIVWNLSSGQVKSSSLEDEKKVHAVAFSPDGKFISLGHRQRASLLDAATFSSINELKGAASSGTALAYSPDDKSFAVGSGDGTVHLWDIKLGREIGRLKQHSGFINALAYDPRGQLIVTASEDTTAVIWNQAAGRIEHVLKGHTEAVNSAAFSPNGKLLVTGSSDKAAQVWDVQTGKKLKLLEGHQSEVVGVRFSQPDGRIIITATEQAEFLWDAETGSQIGILEGHSGGVNSVSFSLDGSLILTGCEDGVARLWQRTMGIVVKRFVHGEAINTAIFSRNGQLILTAGDDDVTKLWEIGTGRQIQHFTGHADDITYAAFHPDGRMVATASEDGTAQTWDVATGRPLKRLAPVRTGRDPVSIDSLAYSPDGKLLATSENDALRVWSVEAGDEVSRWLLTDKSIIDALVGFSPDGKHIAVITGDTLLRFIDAKTGQEKVSLQVKFSRQILTVETAVFSADGKLVMIGGRGYDGDDLEEVAFICDAATGREVWGATRQQQSRLSFPGIAAVAFSHDGDYIVTGNNEGTGRVYELASGGAVAELLSHTGGAAVAFSPDGKQVVTGGNGTKVHLWDVATRKVVRAFEEIDYAINSLMFSPDGMMLLAGGSDHNIYLWNVKTGTRIRRFVGHTSGVNNVAFAKDGKRFLSVSSDGTVRLWDIENERELGSLVSFPEGAWAVVAPSGHFDTNSLESLKGIQWIMPDDTDRALPVEIFMRDYFKTRLLPDLMSGRNPGDVRPLGDLNRAQPLVKIVNVHKETESPELVSVSVEVEESEYTTQRRGEPVSMRSGVYDLRLFRDGQLVGRWPEGSTATEPPSAATALDRWRLTNKLPLESSGKLTHTFRNVRLPHHTGDAKVNFSAYAFNKDRVKSATTPPYPVATSSTSRNGRAYIIAVGVSANQSGWNLDFAEKSAKDLRQSLRDRLTPTYEVVDILLLSTLEPESPRIALKQATKVNIKAVLDLLAGRVVGEEARRMIPNADKLQPATPDDLVLLYISSHGYTDPQDNFYVIPYDTGRPNNVTEVILNNCLARPAYSDKCPVAQEFITLSISSSDLEQWWDGVDAGEAVMILDSCYSASAPGRDFRPGPLGDRGFGQLAYDKGMRILTAAQPDRQAFATMRQGNGRSLLANAIVSSLAANLQLTLDGALKETEKRVPEQFKLLFPDAKQDDVQLPVLLDFTRR